MSAHEKQELASDVRAQVREHYGKVAAEFEPTQAEGCGCAPNTDVVSQMYDAPDVTDLPEDVTGLSLGSGDPVTLAALQPGQTVVDLGSGGGIDCFLAAKRVGETGHVIGVDMTAEMIDKARANQAKLGADNVEFRLGEIEHLPVADKSVDVVISNCVINLSPDKPQAFRDAFRVLKPGGLLAVSDIMTDKPMPDPIRRSMMAWAGCIGGALDEQAYVAAIEAAGFVDVEIEREYIDQSSMDEEIEKLGLGDKAKDGNYVILKAGDSVEVLELDEPVAPNDRPRPFSGKVKARKPLI